MMVRLTGSNNSEPVVLRADCIAIVERGKRKAGLSQKNGAPPLTVGCTVVHVVAGAQTLQLAVQESVDDVKALVDQALAITQRP